MQSKSIDLRLFLAISLLGLATVLLMPGLSLAQGDMIVYPEKGQNQQQQQTDQVECYTWAKQQSGFDPMAAPTASTPPPPREHREGGAGRGLVRGGLLGAAVGAIAGDAGKGAAIGATSGALIGGVRRHDQRERQEMAQQQWEQQQVANYSQGRNQYNRAYAACMEGRGYTVR